MRVDADTRPPGGSHVVSTPVDGAKFCSLSLGIDAALDRVTSHPDLLLAERQRLAGRERDLFLHQVDPGGDFGDGVLHLDARVHLDEVVAALGVDEELERADIPVAKLHRRRNGAARDLLAQLLADRSGRRLLDELLIAALDGAFTLAEADARAVFIDSDLRFDVTDALEAALEVDAIVAERGLRLAARLFQSR